MPGGAAGERLHAIEGSVPSLGALPPGCAFNPRCPSRFEPCAIDPPPDYDAGPGQRAKCYLHAPVPIGSRADTQVGPYEGTPAVPYGGKQARTSEGQEVGSREDQVGHRLAGADRRVRSGGSRGVRPEKDAV